MDKLYNYWLYFILSSLLIIIAGSKLSITADKLAAKTKLSRFFLGSFLLAITTSLPELVTISSAALIEAPDIAIGTIYGSYSMNFLVLVIIDLFHGKGPVLFDTGLGNLLLAFFGILFSSISIFFIILYTLFTPRNIFWLGWESPVILFSYLLSSYIIYQYQKKKKKKKENPLAPAIESLSALVFQFLLCALIIALSGTTLARSGEVLATRTALGESLVGTLFIGLSTSLPELITTITAIKIAAYDLAIGNILGSNCINIAFIAIADLFYRPGPILRSVSLIHVGTAALGIGLTIIAAIGLFYRSQQTFLLLLGWDTGLIFLFYLVGIYLLFF